MSDAPIPILHLDDDLVAIDKPPWSIVHRTRGASGALVLVRALSRQLGRSVFPVHRLDRQTSGVLVFALSREAASQLSADVRQGSWRKRYLGLCRGVVPQTLVVDRPVPEGDKRREARSQFDPVEVFCSRYTLLSATPHSGRRHQLRYHLKHANHPLVGDVGYGKGDINRFFRTTFGLSRMFLHAAWLRIVKPGGSEALEIAAPLPADLDEILQRLRAYEGPVV